MCGCLKAEHQHNVPPGAHHVVHAVPQPQPVLALPVNFDTVTQTSVSAARNVLDRIAERTVHVETALNPHENDFTPIEEKHSHSCYFGPTTWVIADVFKPPGGYGLNQVVERQAQLARAQNPGAVNPTDRPAMIVIKNCINPDTRAFLDDEANPLNISILGFSRTTFGKAVTRILGALPHAAAIQHIEFEPAGHVYITIH